MHYLKKLFLMLLIAVMAVSMIPAGVMAAEQDAEELDEAEASSYEVPAKGTHGFKTINGKRYYYKKDGRLATGWTRINNNRYYMGKNGIVRTGWRRIGGKDYYFNFRGRLVYKGTRTAAKEKQLAFIEMIAAGVKKHGKKYNILCYSAVIGQAILESGWGQSTLASKYYNYFGMKCGTLWKGRSVNLKTKEEYTPGTKTTIYDNFRVYKSSAAGIKGYFEFIDTARYANLKNVKNPSVYLKNIKKDGYATSSTYVQSVENLIKYNNLKAYDPY